MATESAGKGQDLEKTGIVVLGSSGATFLVGSITFAAGMGSYLKWKKRVIACGQDPNAPFPTGDYCDKEVAAQGRSSDAWVAGIAVSGIGVLGLATGAILYSVGKRQRRRADRSVHVMPSQIRGGGGVTISVRF